MLLYLRNIRVAIVVAIFCNFLVFIQAGCNNDCNKKGVCNTWGRCDCFEGWEGNDCSRKSCPKGPALADIPYALDSAHREVECSGQGKCDYSTGICQCNSQYFGRTCSTRKCMNDCNGKGRCISLKTAATENDGYLFNRTTTYNGFDAEIMSGCQCDYGWSGADCSLRVCESGPDPRLEILNRETVTMVCTCTGNCQGRFKLRFLGQPARTWLRPTSRAYEVADHLMTIPGVFSNTTAHYTVPVVATNGSSVNEQICMPSATTTTTITFHRRAGDLPALSFYANNIREDTGSLYFETTQSLICNCEAMRCNGTFRVSFDGEMSERLRTWGDGSDLLAALRGMSTFQSAGIEVSSAETTPICQPGAVNNHTIVMQAAFGNVPQIGLWSTVVLEDTPFYYSVRNASQADLLRLTSNDGRDDNVKLCNGIGKCNYDSGECLCPFGWEYDPDLGPCGRVQVNTSRFAGIARCPGLAAPSNPTQDQGSRRNYVNRLFVSLNPTYFRKESAPEPGGYAANMTQSGIYYFTWRPDSINGPDVDESSRVLFLNLSSNTSAGPLVMDQARERIFYVDQNPVSPFIGLAPARNNPGTNYTVWLTIDYKIFGFALDADFKRRRLYWTVPGKIGVADGAIYYASIDDTVSPTVVSLLGNAGQESIVDPHGLAIHYLQRRVYWVDRNISGDSAANHTSVLRSSNFDGTEPVQVYIYREVDNHTVSTNLTDLIIDFVHNNTAFFIDVGPPGAIVATNLDFPLDYNNDTQTEKQFVGFEHTRIITDTFEQEMDLPLYLALDESSLFVLWSDIGLEQIAFARYLDTFDDFFSPGVGYDPVNLPNRAVNEYFPVFLLFDPGLGPPQWGEYIDCYGNGICAGWEGNWECQCSSSYYGDCNSQLCPMGRAWFHEPLVDDVAHDVMAECSNMGACNPIGGSCTCNDGFEGAACERLSCQGRIPTSSVCSDRGRCLSLRNLASRHKDAELTPAPVVYGSRASDPNTWDADMVYGCAADEYGNYFGEFNISTARGSAALDEFDCPLGYNKRLLDSVFRDPLSNSLVANFSNLREIQQIRCEASGGFFQLRFRGQLTEPIYADTSAAELRNILQALPALGVVEVAYPADQDDRLCHTVLDYVANVTFISQVGAVPLLEVTNSRVIGRPRRVAVVRVQDGSVDQGLLECSGFGECDRATGECQCWQFYSTSDGLGGQGTRGDCGFHDTELGLRKKLPFGDNKGRRR